MKIIILIPAFVLLLVTVDAQVVSIETDSIVWEVDQLTDLSQNQIQSYSCKFISSPQGIVWLQAGDAYKKSLTITSVAGDWSNITQNGSYQYSVDFQNRPGVILFEKTGTATTIKMSFVSNGKDTMPYQFRVTSIAKYQGQ